MRAAAPTWLDRQLEKPWLDGRTALEFELMRACGEALLATRGPADPRRLAGLAARHSTDWSGFLDLLRENRFLPVVHRALCASGVLGDGDPLGEAVRARFKKDSVRALTMTAELVRVVKRLADHAIRVLAFKGPALALQAYGAASMRISKDLDLLVAPEDHERAEKLLLQEGYGYPPGEIPFKAGLARRVASFHTHLVHGRNRTQVELHFDLQQDTFPSLMAFDDLWRERAAVRIASVDVPAFPLSLHGLYLCLHGEQHSWERLIRPFDIAAVADTLGPEGTAGLLRQAERLGLKARVMKGLLLAHLLFGVAIPEEPRRLMSDRRVRAYMELALRMTLAPRNAGERSLGRRYRLRKRVRVAACETGREKWRYFVSHFLPEDADMARVPLPGRLLFLHSFLKPIWTLKRKLDGPVKPRR